MQSQDQNAGPPPQAPVEHRRTGKGKPAPQLALAALGVVFGDLGTSPLYSYQAILGGMGGHVAAGEAIGILSLVVWTLLITISLKYCVLVMRADNDGEGGILALMSLVARGRKHGLTFILGAGLFGAALIYGDGIITPAISVLSALEGLKVATSAFQPVILPLAVVILIGLFVVQRFGTGRIGIVFGPIMLVWFVAIALLGVFAIFRHPHVLWAVDPTHAVTFLSHHGPKGFAILGRCSSPSPAVRRSMPIWAISDAAPSASPGTASCCRA